MSGTKYKGMLSILSGNNLPDNIGPFDTGAVDQFATGITLAGAGIVGVLAAPWMFAGAATISAVTSLYGLGVAAKGSAGVTVDLFNVMRKDGVIDRKAIDAAEVLVGVSPAHIPVALGKIAQETFGKVQTNVTAVAASLTDGLVKGQERGQQTVGIGAKRLKDGFDLASQGLAALVGDATVAVGSRRFSDDEVRKKARFRFSVPKVRLQRNSHGNVRGSVPKKGMSR